MSAPPRRVVLLCLGLSACTVGPSYVRPGEAALGIPDAFGEPSPGTGAVAGTAWWMGLTDPVLDTLVAEAIAASPDIAAAQARLRIARGISRGADGARLPAIGANGTIARSLGAPSVVQTDVGLDPSAPPGTSLPGQGGSQIVGGDTTTFQAALGASWDADLFGGLRRNAEAARADLAAQGFTLANTQAVLVADVATAYLNMRSAQERAAIAVSQLASQDRSVRIVGWRVEAGLASRGDFQSAQALREQTAAQVPLFRESASLATHRLAVLTGRAPSTLAPPLAKTTALPAVAVLPIAGIPSDLLRRRPDVIAAERRLAAETARIGVEKAALYPALELSGTLGGTNSSLVSLPATIFGNLVGNLTAPVFQGGRIRARIEAQRGRADLALAEYRSTVLGAIRDVEDALVATRTADERRRHLAAAVDASNVALTVARDRYRSGLTDFQTLLQAERTSLAARDGEAVARLSQARAAVELFRGLGGGWTR